MGWTVVRFPVSHTNYVEIQAREWPLTVPELDMLMSILCLWREAAPLSREPMPGDGAVRFIGEVA